MKQFTNKMAEPPSIQLVPPDVLAPVIKKFLFAVEKLIKNGNYGTESEKTDDIKYRYCIREVQVVIALFFLMRNRIPH